MNKNNESPVSQKNPLRSFLFGALVFITIILLRFILLFPSYIFDILLNLYSLALSILFIVFYQRKMKYAWHSLLLIYIPLFPIYLYRTIIVGDTLSYIVSIVWVGVILVIFNWRKRYFKYLEQENGIIQSAEQT
jgi:O-antigen/teichoic acid export membrane protein